MLKLYFKPGSKKTLQQMFDRINWGVCDQVTRSDVTEDNGEYSGAFGGRVPHLCLPEDAGVDLDNPPHPLFCQQGDVYRFSSNDNSLYDGLFIPLCLWRLNLWSLGVNIESKS